MQNILDGTSKKCPERALLLRAGGQGIGQESICIIVAALLDAISLTTLTRRQALAPLVLYTASVFLVPAVR